MTRSALRRATLVSNIPARVDRLPWSPFHVKLVTALGACWILDGFEITIASNIGEQLSEPGTLELSPAEIGLLATFYLLGQAVGALVFGHLADRWGRRRMFFVTLAVYMAGSAATALVFGTGGAALVTLYVIRFVAGAGIGGEYAAINSMIDEMVPATRRGRVDVVVNGTYWAGATLAGLIQLPLLSGAVDPSYDWRIALLIGPALAVGVWVLRRDIPESPRWQLLHGREDDAARSIEQIERAVVASGGLLPPVRAGQRMHLNPLRSTGYLRLLAVLFGDDRYRRRAVLGVTLMITQSVLYNALFFSYASVLVSFFGVDNDRTALYIIPFAVGNLLGPICLGRLFDRVGRRRMLSRTYGLAGVLLVGSAFVFHAGGFDAVTQTLVWCVIFFFASAGASAAYLTISEVFPLEVRAKAIAAFFAVTQLCGAAAPYLFGLLIDRADPDPDALFAGYIGCAVLMMVGALTAHVFGVDAENKLLEDVAPPLALVPRTADGEP
jgi:MFS family permease